MTSVRSRFSPADIRLDDDDLHLLTRHHFTIKRKREKYYAETKINGRTVGIHRLVLGVDSEPGHVIVDHRDGDGLNNRRSNLRPATRSQNGANVAHRVGGTSQYKGVDVRNGKYRARLCVDGQSIHLGLFDRERDAALAYDHAALDHFGEYAVTNILTREKA